MLFLKRYAHGLYAPAYLFLIYLPWFIFVEHRVTDKFHIIHMSLDDMIPFNEFFIIPYYIWFFYVSIATCYFIFNDRIGFYKFFTFLGIGMTIFLAVSTVYPNGCLLRPTVFPRNNVFTHMVLKLYKADTNTNIFPSIHVFNSLGVHAAVMNSGKLKDKKGIQLLSLIICISIVLSTMMIKQHSVFDVLTACIMAVILYLTIYVADVPQYIRKLQMQGNMHLGSVHK